MLSEEEQPTLYRRLGASGNHRSPRGKYRVRRMPYEQEFAVVSVSAGNFGSTGPRRGLRDTARAVQQLLHPAQLYQAYRRDGFITNPVCGNVVRLSNWSRGDPRHASDHEKGGDACGRRHRGTPSS